MAQKVEDLPLYRRVDDFSRAVIAILDRRSLRRNRKLWDQLADANDSVVANFAEGFEQSTDAGFANYLVHSKASLAEVVRRLKQAERRRTLTLTELTPLEAEAEELARMLGGFIKYLRTSNFKRRGSYKPGLKDSKDSKDSGFGIRDSAIRD
jgi:four helix bundle protein